ncbi:hypothetical protein [Bacteroides cellulosilyticus]|jgi:hypothetical protein|uniref:hypothetical protein n=1 Tax=Bacteroides cellulosilyticus TaxID=246787 RepID=UPI0032ECACE0
MRGFESYNKFKQNIKDARQIYDITFHLYQSESTELRQKIKSGMINPTIRTSVGSIEHTPTALCERLRSYYPYKLRQLILISTITALEVYLTDVILEVYKRNISPFKKTDENVTFSKSYLLSMSSMYKIQNDLIRKDFRSLTSGGLKEIDKYYKKTFGIDIKNLGSNFQEIEEIHTRRHLFVHRDGFVDSEYATKFPQNGYKIGQKIIITHKYLLSALDKLSEFGKAINKKLLLKFPDVYRKPIYYIGSRDFNNEEVNLMVEISVLKENFDAITHLKSLNVNGDFFKDYIVQITTIDNNCILFISGKQGAISKFFKPIIENKNMMISKTIELRKKKE